MVIIIQISDYNWQINGVQLIWPSRLKFHLPHNGMQAVQMRSVHVILLCAYMSVVNASQNHILVYK